MADVSTEMKLVQISKDLNDLAVSYNDMNSTLHGDGGLVERMRELADALALLSGSIKPVVEIYNGVMFTQKFVVGLSILIVSIGSIGAGAYWLINWIRHGQ